MPEPLYQSQLSLESAKFIVSLSRRRQRHVLNLADQIAHQPFQISDYQTTDAAGRFTENLLVDGYLFTYWVDHAQREVRISEIVAV
jgi:hypothetical protein